MEQGMQIRRGTPEDRDVLFDVWLRSVEATHAFVSEADVQGFKPLVREGSKMESLFLAPEFHRRGGGRRLVEHARGRYDALTVDVNEQNAAAVAFYKACGFCVEGRSELDENGRPYPLLHMRLAAQS